VPTSDPSAHRLSIAERAAKRERMAHSGRDRYASLIRTLQAGRELPVGRVRAIHYEWHPLAWRLGRVLLAAVVIYAAARFGATILRDNAVDTWRGPDAAVQSGQRLSGCAPVNVLHDEVYPTWVRFGGVVYRMAGSRRPVLAPTPKNGYRPTGYTLGSLMLLTIESSPDGRARNTLLIYDNTSPAGELYMREPDCP
jgi:hypothetical protein